MNYKKTYQKAIKNVEIPKVINDDYVNNRIKHNEGEDSHTDEYRYALCGKDISKYDTKNLSRDVFGWIERILRNKMNREEIHNLQKTDELGHQ